jgi:hypothetical protein
MSAIITTRLYKILSISPQKFSTDFQKMFGSGILNTHVFSTSDFTRSTKSCWIFEFTKYVTSRICGWSSYTKYVTATGWWHRPFSCTYWIGLGGSIARPLKSPDLNPLVFFFWGHLKRFNLRNATRHSEQLMTGYIKFGTKFIIALLFSTVMNSHFSPL